MCYFSSAIDVILHYFATNVQEFDGRHYSDAGVMGLAQDPHWDVAGKQSDEALNLHHDEQTISWRHQKDAKRMAIV